MRGPRGIIRRVGSSGPPEHGASRRTAVSLLILGEFGVEVDARPVVVPREASRKARTLLKLLATERGHLVPTDRVVEVLWPEAPPARPVENVATLVSRLRSWLGSGVVEGGREGYRLAPDVEVDLGLRRAADRARGAACRPGRPVWRWFPPSRRAGCWPRSRPRGRAVRRLGRACAPRPGRAAAQGTAGARLRRTRRGRAAAGGGHRDVRSRRRPARRADGAPADGGAPCRGRAGPRACGVRPAQAGARRRAGRRPGARDRGRARRAAARRATARSGGRYRRTLGRGRPSRRRQQASWLVERERELAQLRSAVGRRRHRSAVGAAGRRRGRHRQDQPGRGPGRRGRGVRRPGAARAVLRGRAVAVPPASGRRRDAGGGGAAAAPAARDGRAAMSMPWPRWCRPPRPPWGPPVDGSPGRTRRGAARSRRCCTCCDGSATTLPSCCCSTTCTTRERRRVEAVHYIARREPGRRLLVVGTVRREEGAAALATLDDVSTMVEPAVLVRARGGEPGRRGGSGRASRCHRPAAPAGTRSSWSRSSAAWRPARIRSPSRCRAPCWRGSPVPESQSSDCCAPRRSCPPRSTRRPSPPCSRSPDDDAAAAMREGARGAAARRVRPRVRVRQRPHP